MAEAGSASAADEIRAELAGTHYFVSEREVQLYMVTTSVSGEIVYGRNVVRFTRDKVEWVYQGDISQSAPYQVDAAGNIEATGWWEGRVEGKYDRDSGRLLWKGAWYVPGS